MSENGNRCIVSMQDHFSRFPAAYAIPEATSEAVVDCILRFSMDFGYPKCIPSETRVCVLLGCFIEFRSPSPSPDSGVLLPTGFLQIKFESSLGTCHP